MTENKKMDLGALNTTIRLAGISAMSVAAGSWILSNVDIAKTTEDLDAIIKYGGGSTALGVAAGIGALIYAKKRLYK